MQPHSQPPTFPRAASTAEVRRGSALFASSGRALDADDAWREQWGPPPVLDPGVFKEAVDRASLLEGLGLTPQGGDEGLLGGARLKVGLQRIGAMVVVSLEPVREPAAEAFRTEAEHRSFLRIASHDLRGPLANIRSYASLLMSPRFGLDARALKGVDVIARNADRALKLSDLLFDVWRDERGELFLGREWAQLPHLLEDALAAAQTSREQPGPPPTLTLLALPELALDVERVGSAVRALVLHALDRSPPGSTVRVEATPHGSGARIETCDEGAPLSPETAARAFELGFVVPRARRLDARFELAVAALSVRAHGGKCDTYTDSAGLTHFSFWLPRGEPDQAPASEPAAR